MASYSSDARGAVQYAAVLPTVPADADGELGVAEIIRVILRRKWILVLTMVPAILAALFLLTQLTPQYRAESLILIEAEQGKVVPLDAVVGGLTGDQEAVRSEAYILGSRALASRVVDRLSLSEDPEFNAALREDEIAATLATGAERARQRSAVIDSFLDSLSVAPREASRVISVAFSSEDPAKAARITNTLADEYIQSRLEAKFELTQQASTWLNSRVAELRENVAAAEEAVERRRRELGLVQGNGATLASQELGELNTQLVISRTESAAAQARLRQARSLLNAPGGASTASEVLGSPLIQRLREQEAALERQVAELATEYGERHPRMIQMRAEQEDLQAKIASEVSRIVVGLQNDLNVARARERALQRRVDELKNVVSVSNQNEIELRALQREAEASRALLQTLLSRQKETLSQEDFNFQQADARIISAADIPSEPDFPNKPVILGLAIIGSAFLGLLIILLLELFDDGFRSGDEIERQTGVTSLGFVPLVSDVKKRGAALVHMREKPNSAFGESIRTLRWSLSLAFPDLEPASVLITSSVPGEGKTTIASCLAVSHALADKRTVLIDADMRRPAIHEALDMSRGPGLVDYLRGQAGLDTVVRETGIDGLSFIAAGTPTPNAPNLLGAKALDELLAALRDQFDFIVIDSPPVMAGSDARILCRKVDATVLAVRWASTRRAVARHAAAQLESAGAKLAGALLSLVNARKHAQYGYGDSGAYAGDLKKYYAS